ncbi:Hypothetical protein FKW44_006120, partial [Caligus rogercresseyi]
MENLQGPTGTSQICGFHWKRMTQVYTTLPQRMILSTFMAHEEVPRNYFKR